MYSIDLREKVLESYNNGEGSIRKIAIRFKVSKGFVEKLLKLYRETGDIKPRPHGGGMPPRLDEKGVNELKRIVEERSDLSLKELSEKVEKKTGIKASTSSISRTLKKYSITCKKNTLRSKAKR